MAASLLRALSLLVWCLGWLALRVESAGGPGKPTNWPTKAPTGQPTRQPSRQPTGQPTRQPSRQPTGQPTRQPTAQPTGKPSRKLDGGALSQFTRCPTGQPSGQPTRQPTGQPTRQPSRQPTTAPSGSGSSTTDANALCAWWTSVTGSKTSLVNWCLGTSPYTIDPCDYLTLGTSKQWTGITCSSVFGGNANRVTTWISTTGSGGTLPTAIGAMNQLTYLQFSTTSCALTGTVPTQIGALTRLATLAIYNSQLTGTLPTSLFALTRLTQLRLSGNNLGSPAASATIPTLIGGLTALTYLALDSNRLTGQIPSQLGQLTNLKTLQLGGQGSYKLLTGTIPVELAQLTNLQGLSLASANLNGATIPTQLAGLKSLTSLTLSASLAGPVPTFIASLSSLKLLSLGYNKHTSYSVPTFLGGLTALTSLDISGTSLQGGIATTLGTLTNLVSFSAAYMPYSAYSIPSQLGTWWPKLATLYLRGSSLKGSIPESIGRLTSLTSLDLSSNRLTGQVPQSFCSLSTSIGTLTLANTCSATFTTTAASGATTLVTTTAGTYTVGSLLSGSSAIPTVFTASAATKITAVSSVTAGATTTTTLTISAALTAALSGASVCISTNCIPACLLSYSAYTVATAGNVLNTCVYPTGQPTGQPSRQPTGQPSRQPTSRPSLVPQPSAAPNTAAPTPALPTLRNGSIGLDTAQTLTAATITVNFTVMWDLRPDEVIHIYLPRFTRRLKDDMKLAQTAMPSRAPSAVPTRPPQFSFPPTPKPSPSPPSPHPTLGPTAPTVQPSPKPSSLPTPAPTVKPTPPLVPPSGQPTSQPSRQPTSQPTAQPTRQPTGQPTRQPSRQPTAQPTSQPSGRPTVVFYPRHASTAPLRQPTTSRPTQYYELKARPLDIALGSLILSPSTLFLGAWTEGDWRNYNASHAETNYPGGMITLSRAQHVNMTASPQSGWIKSNTVVSIKVYRENGIGAYCGFPGSASPDAATYFSSNVNHGGLNANLYDRDKRFLILTNYSVWPTEGQYPIHTWPNNLYSGLKNRLLPNVSYYVPNWPSMGQGCSKLKPSGGCSGHGQCDWCKETCSCFQGWGSSMDLLTAGLKAPADCSLRTCPSGAALSDVPVAPSVAHRQAECSNAGRCNRQSGTCECFPPWTGAACDRMRCPNDCSGHGKCLSIHQIARLASMAGGHYGGVYYGRFTNYGLGFLPAYSTDPYALANATHISSENSYQDRTGAAGAEQPDETAYFSTAEGSAWDKDRMRACVCDSSWPVGLGLNERQLSEWFGPDCSLRHCPSGDDPFTSRNELHCNGINQLSSDYPEKGHIGNYCQVDCANRGVCDYSTGKCACFAGSYGDNCAVTARTGVYPDAARAPDEEYAPPQGGSYADPAYATQQIELARFY